MSDLFSIEFVAEGVDPLQALNQFVDVATPVLARFGYTVEGRVGSQLMERGHLELLLERFETTIENECALLRGDR